MKRVSHIEALLKQLPRMQSGIGSYAKANEIQNRIYELTPEEFTRLVYRVEPDQMVAIIKKCNLEPDPLAWLWWIVQVDDFGYAWHHKITIAGWTFRIYGEC